MMENATVTMPYKDFEVIKIKADSYDRLSKDRIKKKQLSRMKKLRREALLKGVYLGGVVWNSEMNTNCSLI